MNGVDQRIADCLRTRLAGVSLDDTAALGRILNAVAEEPTLSAAKTSFAVLQMAVEEGVPRLIKEAATMNGGKSLNGNLDRLVQRFAAKRHLAATAGEYGVRVWTAALDAAPSSATIQTVTSPIAPGPCPTPLVQKRRRLRIAAGGIVIVVVVGLGWCFYREAVQLLKELIAGIALLAYLYFLWEIFRTIFSWPIRKLSEGLKQIKCALDWTPGWVYIIVLAVLGIADWFGVLPYGVRDVAAFLDDTPKIDGGQRPTNDGRALPENFAIIDAISVWPTLADATHRSSVGGRVPPPNFTMQIFRSFGQSTAMTEDVDLKRPAVIGTGASTFDKDGKYENAKWTSSVQCSGTCARRSHSATDGVHARVSAPAQQQALGNLAEETPLRRRILGGRHRSWPLIRSAIARPLPWGSGLAAIGCDSFAVANICVIYCNAKGCLALGIDRDFLRLCHSQTVGQQRHRLRGKQKQSGASLGLSKGAGLLEEEHMTQSDMDCECKPDRIVMIVERAMDDLIFREDPDFYDGTGPGGEIRAALMIGCIRRRSQNGVAIEAMALGFDRSELPSVWEELQRVASNALAKHRSEGLTTSVNGPIN